MSKAVYLEPNKVPAHLRSGYTGKKFVAIPCENMRIPSDAGLWSEGSRETYTYIRLDDGKTVEAVNHNASPWNKTRGEVEVDMKAGYAVVVHKIFCGKDMGLTFYVHPSDIAAMLPAPISVSENAKRVLNVIASYKSSYRNEEYQRIGLSPEVVGMAKEELFLKYLITAKGSITISGRNVRGF